MAAIPPITATNGAVISEFDDRQYGQPSSKHQTAANIVSTVAVSNGARLTSVGTHKSDGGRHNIGEDN